jgi:hypothetical protein
VTLTLDTSTRARRADGTDDAPTAAALRLSGVGHVVLRERDEALIGGDHRLAREILEAYGRADEFDNFLERRGNSFITMSERLLDAVGFEPAPVDAVLLAYQTPDLYYSDVAGCYLAERLPGAPVPFSVAEQGPGAVFTALRAAQGMSRLGELNRAALFAYDQNAAVWEANDAVQALPDSAVLLQIDAVRADGAGPRSDPAGALVRELTETRTEQPAIELERLLELHPGAEAAVGGSLWAELGPATRERYGIEPPPEHLLTAAWITFARRWPTAGPVLVADYHKHDRRLYSCLCEPDDAAGGARA